MDMNWMVGEVSRLMAGQGFTKTVKVFRSIEVAEVWATMPGFSVENCFSVKYMEVQGGPICSGILVPEWMSVSKEIASIVLAHELGHEADLDGDIYKRTPKKGASAEEELAIYIASEKAADEWACNRLGCALSETMPAMALATAHVIWENAGLRGATKAMTKKNIGKAASITAALPGVVLRFGEELMPKFSSALTEWLDILTDE